MAIVRRAKEAPSSSPNWITWLHPANSNTSTESAALAVATIGRLAEISRAVNAMPVFTTSVDVATSIAARSIPKYRNAAGSVTSANTTLKPSS